MPRPRAPTRDLFEFTNRRRAGGKCDVYRCKRCGREMLENTHRFAIHISICKAASDQDREIAKGQLRKTKKYRMRANNAAAPPPTDSGCHRSDTLDGNSIFSGATLQTHQDELFLPPPPTIIRRVINDYPSQQNKHDMFDGQFDSTTTIFDTSPISATTPLFDFEDHCRMAASNLFDSQHYRPATAMASAHPMAADNGIRVFGNHHQGLSAPAMMFDQSRPYHYSLLPHRQRYDEVPPTNNYYQPAWGSPVYSSPFESATRGRMDDTQPYMI